jgi:hypothetical protein
MPTTVIATLPDGSPITEPLFPDRRGEDGVQAEVMDVASIAISVRSDAAPDYVVPGLASIRYSTDGDAWSAPGDSFPFALTTTPRELFIQAVAAADGPIVTLPPATLVATLYSQAVGRQPVAAAASAEATPIAPSAWQAAAQVSAAAEVFPVVPVWGVVHAEGDARNSAAVPADAPSIDGADGATAAAVCIAIPVYPFPGGRVDVVAVRAATSEFHRTANFTGAAGSAIPASIATKTAGSGTARLDGNGRLVLDSAAAGDATIAYRALALDLGATKSYKWKPLIDSARTLTQARLFAVVDSVNAPDPSISANATHALSINANTDTTNRTRLSCAIVGGTPNSTYLARGTNTTANTLRFWNGAAWAASGAVTTGIANDTDIVCIFETYYDEDLMSSMWVFTVKTADESSTIFTTGAQDWAGITAFSNGVWLMLGGDPYTDGQTCRVSIDWFDEAA